MVRKWLVFVLLPVSLAACSAARGFGNLGTFSVAGAKQAAPRAELCANPLVPIKQGATWSYVNTGAQVAPLGLSTTITSVRPDGFTVATNFDDNMTADQEWICTADGLIAHSIGAAQATLGLSLSGFNAALITIKPAGITLPYDVAPGKHWQSAITVTGNVSRSNNLIEMDGLLNTDWKAVGYESVTLPAGTFNALRIDAKSTFNVNADLYGLGIPISSSVNSRLWFAPGIGWIKSVQSGDLPGMSINSVTELQSYHIP